MDTAGVVIAYVRAWHEQDVATTRALVEQTWAVHGVYADPGGVIEGREALVDAIAEFHASRPGVRIEIRSAIDSFDRHFRFAWATVDERGDVLREGIDVGRLDDDGRIESIVGFYGLAP